jgi:hypothetical protein
MHSLKCWNVYIHILHTYGIISVLIISLFKNIIYSQETNLNYDNHVTQFAKTNHKKIQLLLKSSRIHILWFFFKISETTTFIRTFLILPLFNLGKKKHHRDLTRKHHDTNSSKVIYTGFCEGLVEQTNGSRI